MDLVDEQDGVRLLLQTIEHLFHALLEVAAIAGAGDQRSEIEGKDLRVAKHVRHLTLLDAQREPFRERRLSDARFTDQQRVVLPAAAQDLDHALKFELATNQRIDLPLGGARDQIGGIRFERIGRRRAGGARLARLGHRLASAAVRDHPQERQSIEPLALQEERGVAFLLLQHEDEQASAINLLCARHRRMHDGLLDDAIESDGRLGLDRTGSWNRCERLGQHFVDLLAKRIEVDAARRQQPPRLRFVGERAQQMLEADGVVPPVACQAKGALNGLEGFRRKGNWRLAHMAMTLCPRVQVPSSPAAGTRVLQRAASWP